MSRRRPRGLRPEEQELWQKVASSAQPMHLRAPAAAPPEPPAIPAPVAPVPPVPGARVKVERLPEAWGSEDRQGLWPPEAAPRGFRVGEKVRGRPVTLDLAPAPGEALAAQPVMMDHKTHKSMTRGRITPEAKIDLHGMTLAEAHPELIRFILSSQDDGRRLVLVITGKGKPGREDGPIPQRRGVLRHQVPQWLRMMPLGAAVLQVTQAHLRHGGEGAYYVYLRRAGR